jgi:hypothetical protein
MARIMAGEGTKLYQIKRWLGVNESPDGDSGLKLGQAAVMRNFRVTRENHLQVRPGYAAKLTLAAEHPVRGLWFGSVEGTDYLLAACGGHVWKLDRANWTATDLGEIQDGGSGFFFGFGNKVYLLTGAGYYSWDGTGQVIPVEGYIPIVVTAAPPEGGGTLLERVNLLTGKRRQQSSPDGTATTFQLAEVELDELLAVEGTDLTYTADLEKGQVTFASPPPKGINSLTFTWRKGAGEREKITGMRFAELFNGAADSRVFLYGDGSNQAVYTGIGEDLLPTAEYFPDLNTIAVGEANTPITAMIRHYDRMIVYKTHSAHACQYATMTLADGSVTAAFYTTPLNREIGCQAPGQARLVDNDPRTLAGRGVYAWSLAAGSTRDERNARRISDRVEDTLASFSLDETIAFDDEARREYYVFCRGRALVHNYANDTWYGYTNLPVSCIESVAGELYFGTGDGRVMHLSRRYRNDNLTPIDAYWESGSMDFDMDWRKKFSPVLWLSIKPESQGRIQVTLQTNRRSDHEKRTVAANLASFSNVNFAHWSFGTNRKPQVSRVKLKGRKFTFYKLIFSSQSASATATILSADLKVRYSREV